MTYAVRTVAWLCAIFFAAVPLLIAVAGKGIHAERLFDLESYFANRRDVCLAVVAILIVGLIDNAEALLAKFQTENSRKFNIILILAIICEIAALCYFSSSEEPNATLNGIVLVLSEGAFVIALVSRVTFMAVAE